MPALKRNLLHIASFDGNIGDNASHNGFYRQLRENTAWEISVQQKEIRKTYLNYPAADRWFWDDDLIAQMGEQDVTIVGGGNYFELWLENSRTGTTIDLNPESLRNLKSPLFFNAVGCDPNIGVTQETIERFRGFVETVLQHPMCMLTVRNDGSSKYLTEYLGQEVADQIEVVPDPGFFVDPGRAELPRSLEDKRFWVLNLAKDRPERRFPGTSGKLDYKGFITEISGFIEEICLHYPDLQIVLVPHIFSDLDPIRDVMAELPDPIRRWRISVAPLLHGMGAEKTIFALYKEAELAMGPRFHANVCPIGLGTPTLGLVTTQKLTDLYEELGIPERAIDAQTPGFGQQLLQAAEKTLRCQNDIKADYRTLRANLKTRSDEVYRNLESLVDS